MFFYVIFAAVLCFKRQYCLPLMFAWGGVTLAISVLSHSLHNVYLETYASPLMLEFIAGVLTGYLIKTRSVRFSIPLIVAGIACIVAADLYYPAFDAAHALNGYLRFLIVGIPMAFIFAGVVGVEINYGRTFPAWLLVVGNASYSLYLWHEPLTVLAGRLSVRYEGLLHHSAMHAIWLAGVAAFVIGASIALYCFVERPLLKFFSRRLDTVAVMRAPRAVPGL
jgi:peptidoglycan/LPS O-acetylase OafA/YrhL